MAYDEDLAARIRDLIGPDPELTEKKMFGGLAFLIRGHMAISASGQGGVLEFPPWVDVLHAARSTAKATFERQIFRYGAGWLGRSSMSWHAWRAGTPARLTAARM